MNNSNLIDLSGNTGNILQSPSPIKQDPFDLVLECALKNDDCENKENINVENTPTPRKNKKISKEPLFLEKECAEPTSLKRKDLKHLIGVCQKSPNLESSLLNSTNDSLQCLNDSAFNNSDLELNESLDVAVKIPLPASPETEFKEKLQLLDQEKNSLLKSIQENVDSGGNSLFNNAFVNDTSNVNCSSLSSLASKDSYKNFSLFNGTSVRAPDVSNIRLSASSSVSTKSYGSPSLLNVAFLKNSLEQTDSLILQRGCSSARKPTKSERALSYLASVSDTPKQNFNNSFSGFNVQERRNHFKLNGIPRTTDDKNDSVFIEAKQMADMFSRMDELDQDSSDDCDLSDCSPPWIDPSNENQAEKSPKEQEVCDVKSVQAEPENDNVTSSTDNVVQSPPTNSEESQVVLREPGQHKQDKALDRRSLGEDLLNTLTLALRLSGPDDKHSEQMDRRKLGRSLLDTLTLAFNMDSPDKQAAGPGVLDLRVQRSTDTEEALDLSMSSGAFKTPNKERPDSPECPQRQLPRIQISSGKLPAAVHPEARLKPKNDKDKAVSRGPLKAVIPLRNMTKSQKSAGAGLKVPHAAQPEHVDGSADFGNKRTSTPNVPKTRGPIAQSTPDMRKLPTDAESKSACKSKLRYSLSPLAKRAGPNEPSDLNKSLPSRNVSGTTPVKRANTLSSKDSLNTSIPSITGSKSILRRKSASDLKENSALQKANPPARASKRASELKRSSSFQSKISSAFRSIRTKTSLAGPAK